MKKYLLIYISFFFQFLLVAQNHYHIKLEDVEQNNPKKSCYNIQLAAADGIDFNVAGQNYRLYYDASKLSYASSNNLLSAERYDDFRAKDYKSKGNAQGVGNLPFNDEVGLLSISMDLKEVEKGGKILSSLGTWENTCQVCFDKINSGEGSQEKGKLIWAREELTSNYATAYVEVAEWIGENDTEPAMVDQYEDSGFGTTAISSEQWEDKIAIYPNPVKSHLWIDQKATAETKLEVWSINGQQSIRSIIDKGVTHHLLDIKQLSPGAYQQILIKNNQQHIHFFEKLD